MEIEFEETKLNFPEIKYECKFALQILTKQLPKKTLYFRFGPYCRRSVSVYFNNNSFKFNNRNVLLLTVIDVEY